MSLTYTDLKPGVFFRMHGTLYETLQVTVSKKSRQKGSATVRLRRVDTGSTLTKTIHPSDTLEEVLLDKEEYVFVYQKNNEAVIHPAGAPNQRITVPIGDAEAYQFIPSNQKIIALLEGDTIVTITVPIKVIVTVTEAPPSIRGNTTQGGSKKVAIETGATVTAPLFIETGDRIVVKPADGLYVERAK